MRGMDSAKLQTLNLYLENIIILPPEFRHKIYHAHYGNQIILLPYSMYSLINHGQNGSLDGSHAKLTRGRVGIQF